MSNFLFNHGCLINEDDDQLDLKLLSLAKIIEELKKKETTLSIVDTLWNIQTKNGLLADYIRKGKHEKSILIVQSLMSSGPFFSMNEDFTNFEQLTIAPSVPTNSFGYNFLYSNVLLEETKNIISFEQPVYLESPFYKYSVENLRGEVLNILGVEKLFKHFNDIQNFTCISDVFAQVESDFSNVIILNQAKKSAQRHNFHGSYSKVYIAFKGLSEIETKPLSREETRESRFQKNTGLEISGESQSTLSRPRLKAEREFMVQGLGKVLFEWHVKISNHTRIHYYYDQERELMYVAHCGYHLETSNYNS